MTVHLYLQHKGIVCWHSFVCLSVAEEKNIVTYSNSNLFWQFNKVLLQR